MNLELEDRWRGFVEKIVKEGRFDSASEVVEEASKLVEARETGRRELRHLLDTSIARGGEVTDGDLDEAIASRVSELRGLAG